ncbi:MAG: PQQ-dependent sugar dehydrogenase [bacterium]|nr:PQQ-dependent sugar dehydrogenase [bacterium]
MKGNKRFLKPLFIGFIALLIGGVWFTFGRGENSPAEQVTDSNQSTTVTKKYEPNLNTETIVSGHSNIWDLVFPDTETAFYSLRAGEIWGYSLKTDEKWKVASVGQVLAQGEGGLLGLALDTNFADNRYGYMCYNSTGTPKSVRVARFRTAEDRKSISDIVEIVRDIESQAGRHSGCRLAMDKNEHLWVATGDSALGTSPQNPKSLAGKVLRIDRDGRGVNGNLGDQFDTRIFSYGHRNIQGLVLFDEPINGSYGFTAEHGPDRDDEINQIKSGNYGWDPVKGARGYNESVPMTDKTKFPDAIDALWSSGRSTIAVSGIERLSAEHWSAWRDRLAIAVLKDKQIRLMEFDDNHKLISEQTLFQNEFGRIRAVREGPDGNLYFTTDNGNDDKIIRVSPKATF